MELGYFSNGKQRLYNSLNRNFICNLFSEIYRLDRPKSTHQVGRDWATLKAGNKDYNTVIANVNVENYRRIKNALQKPFEKNLFRKHLLSRWQSNDGQNIKIWINMIVTAEISPTRQKTRVCFTGKNLAN